VRILLVDDDPGILDLLREALIGKHEVLTAESGEQALALTRASRAPRDQGSEHPERLEHPELPEVEEGGGPDLVIVDVGLPGIDGLETAQRLRAACAGDSYLPVVAITGQDDPAVRARAYEVGCDDVLPKPFSMAEVRARVESLLLRRREHAELRTLAKMREDLAALVVHDLRNPLSALRMNLELLVLDMEDPDPMVRETLSDCLALTQRTLTLVGGLLDVAELEEGHLRVAPTEVDLKTFVPKLWMAHQPTVRLRRITLGLEVLPEDLKGCFDPDLVGRVVENLLDNAVRYAPVGGRVQVGARRFQGPKGSQLVLSVANDGPPVPAAERERLFEKFYRIERRRAGARANRGLGLYFCKLVAEAHGGSISIGEAPGWPCVFTLSIPEKRE
jgi:signal transduction histidine kinase